MSTNSPRYTIIAHTDNGDFPRYAYDPILARVLVGEAVRSRHVGTVTVEEHQVELGRADTSDPEAVADLLALVATDPIAA